MIEIDCDDLRIHDLRDLARSLRIKAPATRKRAELIRLIKLASRGKLPAEETITDFNKGRPAKGSKVIEYSDSKPLLKELLKEIEKLSSQVENLKERIKKCID